MTAPRHNRFERWLLKFYGPPSVGDVSAPSTLEPDPERDLCPRCHRPWDEHTVTRTDNRTIAHCPE